ncbi:MAG: hypothetical protein AABX11_02115 [Nanoarchaeota archaeon]
MSRDLRLSITSGLAITLFYMGVENLAEGISKRNSVRDAVYAKAERITPEVINEATNLSAREGSGRYFLGALDFFLAGAAGVVVYSIARRKEE